MKHKIGTYIYSKWTKNTDISWTEVGSIIYIYVCSILEKKEAFLTEVGFKIIIYIQPKSVVYIYIDIIIF